MTIIETPDPWALPLVRRSNRRPKATVYLDEAGEWRWRLTARNGKVLTGGEGHTRKRDAWRAFRTARDDMAAAELVVEA